MQERKIEGVTFIEFWEDSNTKGFVYNVAKFVNRMCNHRIDIDDIIQELAIRTYTQWNSEKMEPEERQNLHYIRGCIKGIAKNISRHKNMGSSDATAYLNDAKSSKMQSNNDSNADNSIEIAQDHHGSVHKRNGKYIISGLRPEDRHIARDIIAAAHRRIKEFPKPRTKTEANRQRIIREIFDPSEEFFSYLKENGSSYQNSARLEFCTAKDMENYLGVSWVTIQATIKSFQMDLGILEA